MTCNSNCYLPNPPRAWSRVQNSCSLSDDFQEGRQVKLPYSGKLVPTSTLYLEYAMLNKGNVLQYKKNSSNLTKQQRYAQIAKGLWTNRNTTWATQSTRGYTNPNNQSLERANSINITLDGAPTTAPVTCPKPTNIVYPPLPPSNNGGSANPEVIPPPPPPPTEGSGTALPPAIVEPPVEPIVIRDLGTLVCGTQENVCTGEIIRQPTDIICHPTSDSDVPGPLMELCWNDGTPTWYPRQRYIMTNSTNKWPVNATLLSAINIPAPVITSVTNIGNEVTLTWTQDETCLPVTEFIIYEDDIPIKIVSGTTFSTSIIVENTGIYIFYIVARNSNIISELSNSVTVIIDNSCYYNISGNYSVTQDNTSYIITFDYNSMNTNFLQLSCPVNNISVTLVGGGGGGGSGENITGGNLTGGGGGGGGGIFVNNINFTPDIYNFVVGNFGQGSIYEDEVSGNGDNTYIQNSSSTIIAISYGGKGGVNGNLGGAGGIGGTGGGNGGKGGTGYNSGFKGTNGLILYSGGGGGGYGGSSENGIGQGGQYNIGGNGGYQLKYSNGNGVGYGTGGGGGNVPYGGGNGVEGVIILKITKV